jgi:hypothetical protein
LNQGDASHRLGWSQDPGPPMAGNVSAIFHARGTLSKLSIFLDESGTFSSYDHTSPYYLVSLVFHDQTKDISENIRRLDEVLNYLDSPSGAIHTAPLIRREFDYVNLDIPFRRKIFNSLFTFFRHVDITYKTIVVEKKQVTDSIELVALLSKKLSRFLIENRAAFAAFDDTAIYYDNGQTELTKLIVSVFNSVLDNVSFRKIAPSDYKLAQVADLCCTVELLALKICNKAISKSEHYFFPSMKRLKKSYITPLRKKSFDGSFDNRQTR